MKLKGLKDIEMMWHSGQLAAKVLEYIEPFVKPGISTEKLNTLCHEFIVDHGAYPSPLDYHGFPKSICTSVNEVICHGIPSDSQILQDGDIINVDITVFLNGYHGDTSKTYFVGENIPEKRRLVVDVAAESLARALVATHENNTLGDIGHAIQSYAESQKCSVVEEFVGHGIGKVFHEDPQVLHYGKPRTGLKLRRGMTFTIEPMINAGTKNLTVWPDKWTAVTLDNEPSGQFEHTLAIVSGGICILTALPHDPIVKRAQELGAQIVNLF